MIILTNNKDYYNDVTIKNNTLIINIHDKVYDFDLEEYKTIEKSYTIQLPNECKCENKEGLIMIHYNDKDIDLTYSSKNIEFSGNLSGGINVLTLENTIILPQSFIIGITTNLEADFSEEIQSNVSTLITEYIKIGEEQLNKISKKSQNETTEPLQNPIKEDHTQNPTNKMIIQTHY